MEPELTEPSRAHWANSELNRTTTHRTFQSPQSKLWIKWNQNSPGSSGLTAPSGVRHASFPHQAWCSWLVTTSVLGCPRRPHRLAALTPPAALRLLTPHCFVWLPLIAVGAGARLLLLLVDHVQAHWHHLDLVKALHPRPSAADCQEDMHLTRFLNYLQLHNKSLQNIDAKNSKHLWSHAVSEGQGTASLDGSGSVLLGHNFKAPLNCI